MIEVWKDIIDFEGYYKVSNLGNIYSVKSNRVMKTYINNNGYASIKLTKNKVRYSWLVHRLVALRFCDGYEEGLVVNHIDGNRLNNQANNLEWCTTKDNIYDMIRRGTMNYTKAQSIAKIKNQKPIILITPNNEILEFPSIKSACNRFNLNTGKASMVAQGKRTHTKGFKFSYKDDDIV